VCKNWGGAPYEDIMMGVKEALDKHPYMNPDRMAALGASFGGYMVLLPY
jgi:dipeptidyl aminopeptidase/acylaminoacyl peptidase